MSKGGRWADERACGHSCVIYFSQDVVISEVVCMCVCVCVTVAVVCVRQLIHARPVEPRVCSCLLKATAGRRSDPTANVGRARHGDCSVTGVLEQVCSCQVSLFIKPY